MSGSSIVETTAAKEEEEAGKTELAVAVGSSFAGEIGVTKAEAEPGKEEAAKTTGMVTEASGIEFVFPVKPPVGLEHEQNAQPPTGAMITKEKVPDCFIDRLKDRCVFKKLPPIDDSISDVYIMNPKLRDGYNSNMFRWNYLVDLHEDVLRQHAEKGFAEVGVDFTDGVKKIFILPQH